MQMIMHDSYGIAIWTCFGWRGGAKVDGAPSPTVDLPPMGSSRPGRLRAKR